MSELQKEIKSAIAIARELHYPVDVLVKLSHASSQSAITRILIDARRAA